MGVLILAGVVIFLIVLITKAAKSGQTIGSSARRVHARGLVLSAAQLSMAVRKGGLRYEQRQMTIEVEIPGEAPYVTSGMFLLPRGMVDGVPGSSLDVVVDRSDPSSLGILGPGGFTGPWLRVGPPRPY